MKQSISILPLLAAAQAFVVPDPEVFSQVAISTDRQDQVDSAKDSFASFFDKAIDTLSSGVETAVHTFEDLKDGIEGILADEDYLDEEDDAFEEDWDHPRHRHPHHGHGDHGHHSSNLTIYQLIQKSNYTEKFAKLVDEYDDIVELLNSTKANYTLFVPTDKAFPDIPDDKKPSKEFVEAVLKYHIGLGLYPAGRLLVTHTLPTALDEDFLGGKPQRLRTRIGLGGLRVNFYSKVFAANYGASNGIIHAVDHILVPPPFVGKELALFPSRFSTLLYAYEKTDFVKYIHGIKTNGTTLFAPSNSAWAKLGPHANAFLFNTEKGLKYLKALLKYQIVANATLYSDELYENDGDDEAVGLKDSHFHVDLPTLLGDKSIAVDLARWKGFIRIRLNGYVPVVVQDAVAKNGVVQVVGSVPLPPHKHHSGHQEVDGEACVGDLMERLADYVEEDDVDDEKATFGDL